MVKSDKPWIKEYQEIAEVIDRTPESRLKRERLKKDIYKTLKRVGHLDYSLFPANFRWNLCAARLRLGRFDNWDGFEFRSDWACTFFGFNGYKLKAKRWGGEKPGKIILLGEQGVGDEIMFASAIPDLIKRVGAEKIEYQTYPRLIPMMSRSFGVECVPRKNLGQIEDEEGQYLVALADLLMFYRKKPEDFPRTPYLKPDPGLVEYYTKELDKLGDKPKIGIGWKARHGDLNPEDLMCEDAIYVNLQYLAHPDGNWTEPLPRGVVDFGIDPLKDMDQHLALVAALDKVVTVTQTTVHEAGAVGTECHAIRPSKGTGEVNNILWYYGLGNLKSPVYGCVTIWSTPSDYARSLDGPSNTK